MMRVNGGNQPYSPVFEDLRMNFRSYTPMMNLDTFFAYQDIQAEREFRRARYPRVLRLWLRVRRNGGCVCLSLQTRGLIRGHTRSPPMVNCY